MLSLAGSACSHNYNCADVSFDGQTGGEWCGPLGSFAYWYVQDEVVQVFLSTE